MRFFIFLFVACLICSATETNVFAEKTYTNEDVKNMMHEPDTVSYIVPAPAPKKIKKRANPGGIIDCAKAVENQTGQINIGHPEVCIEVPKQYNSPLIVNSWIGNDKVGYYYIDENSKIDFSKWKNRLDSKD